MTVGRDEVVVVDGLASVVAVPLEAPDPGAAGCRDEVVLLLLVLVVLVLVLVEVVEVWTGLIVVVVEEP